MTDKELMQQALEALEHIQRSIGMGTATIHFGSSTWEQSDAAINVLRERLARPEPYDQAALELCDKCGWKAQIPGDVCVMCKWQKQPDPEPVAWMSPGKERLEFSRKDTVYGSHTIPLYTAPPRREWQGLKEKNT